MKELKVAGDVTLAGDIGRLVRPSAAAWCLNLLAVTEPALAAAFSGQLMRTLEYGGLDPVDLNDAIAVPDRTASAEEAVAGQRGEGFTSTRRRAALLDAAERAKKIGHERAAWIARDSFSD